MSKQVQINKAYRQLLQDILQEIELHKIKAACEVNITLMQLYYSIGEIIVKKQKEEGWGKAIVEQLATDLTKTMAGSKSYSSRNLWYMRQFYLEYVGNEEFKILALQVPWGQNILLLTKIKDDEQRKFYLEKTIEAAWSRKTLLNMVKTNTYKRQLGAPKTHNFQKTLPAHLLEQADEIIKSKYTLDFLNIYGPILERQLENKLIEHLRDFILELGYGFTYIGNQYKLSLNDKEYFVDLLFFHRKLQCLVAIDLKIGDFEPEFAGKMNFYLNLLNEKVRMPDENYSIGIILCAEKDNVEVEYALSGMQNPIGVVEYTFEKRLPQSLKGELPSVKELKERIQSEIKHTKKNTNPH
ncbi:MAG: DUF1016 family protein [Bacteroidales bacterium]|nr:DUF1016 family protein [Bacteroidales bacterium]